MGYKLFMEVVDVIYSNSNWEENVLEKVVCIIATIKFWPQGFIFVTNKV